MAEPLFLTHKQRQFILNYIRGMSGTEAALNAYKVSSRNTAAVIASENLRKPNILALINALAPKGYILENSVKAIGEGLQATKGVKSSNLGVEK